MTKREATEKWVGEFNAIPQGMLEKLWRADIDSMQELTRPRVGDEVYYHPSNETCEIVEVYRNPEEYGIKIGDEVVYGSIDDISVERYDDLPMWGTMWTFGDSCDNHWLEEMGGIQVMSDHGFRIYEHEEYGYFFGIDGAGYSFYDQHWLPLYEARGLQWHDITQETMKVLVVEPEKEPYEMEINTGLEAMQQIVGGDIQAVYPYDEPVALVCHEEGKVLGLPLNRALYDDRGEMYDIMAGTFFVCGVGADNFASLSPEDMAKFKERFRDPEVFVNLNGKITAIPMDKQAMEQASKKPSLLDSLAQGAQKSREMFGDGAKPGPKPQEEVL